MISIERLSIQQGAFSLRDVSFEIPTGSYGVLMGKTGCGKTSILEALCGLRKVASGIVRLDGQDATRWKPGARGIGYVPQDRALFSTMTVRDHLGFALRIRKRPATEIDARVKVLAKLLGIAHLLSRRPLGLSGGEAQRVALGRALSLRPKILLFDEPLSALDAGTWDEMCELLRTAQREAQATVLHITHSAAEAQRLGECVMVLEDGQVRMTVK